MPLVSASQELLLPLATPRCEAASPDSEEPQQPGNTGPPPASTVPGRRQVAAGADDSNVQLLSDLLESSVGKALLRRFDDASEGVRDLATSTFLALLQVQEGVAGHSRTGDARIPLLPYRYSLRVSDDVAHRV